MRYYAEAKWVAEVAFIPCYNFFSNLRDRVYLLQFGPPPQWDCSCTGKRHERIRWDLLLKERELKATTLAKS